LRRRALSHADALHGYMAAPRQAYSLEMKRTSPVRRQNFGLEISLARTTPGTGNTVYAGIGPRHIRLYPSKLGSERH
jgi:hypothetical protein